MLLEEDGNYIHMKCGVALICNKWVVTSGLDFQPNQCSSDLNSRISYLFRYSRTGTLEQIVVKTDKRRLCT